MAWIALRTQTGSHFCPRGLGEAPDRPDCGQIGQDGLLPRGSLVFETRLPPLNRPRSLVLYDSGGAVPLHLSLQALPGGGLVFVLDQNGEMLQGSINSAENGRADILRVSYCWDALAGRGQIVLERPEEHVVHVVAVDRPQPLPVSDLQALVDMRGKARIAPEVVFLAVSTDIEPVGPQPSLAPDTPIATPSGYRPARQIRPGDRVRGADGRDIPVLACVSRTVPAVGSFEPVALQAPYFGLRRDIKVASFQRLLVGGSVVEYMFGREMVLAPAVCLSRCQGNAEPAAAGAVLTTYMQLILPRNEALVAAGTALESLNIGRIRRKPARLDASLLAGFDRARLPEHPCPMHRVLQPFEAVVLAEARAA